LRHRSRREQEEEEEEEEEDEEEYEEEEEEQRGAAAASKVSSISSVLSSSRRRAAQKGSASALHKVSPSLLRSSEKATRAALLSAIARSQVSDTHLLSAPAFQRHVDMLAQSAGVTVGVEVIALLQEAVESYLVDLFTHARNVAAHACRDRVDGADIRIVCDIRSDHLRFPPA